MSSPIALAGPPGGAKVRETEATGIHYLGVVIPALMNEPPSPR